MIELEPTLDGQCAGQVLQDLEQRSGERGLVLDLSRVERFDSAGMGAVVEGLRRARERGHEVRLRGIDQSMRDFFSLLSLERLTRAAEAAPQSDPFTRLGGFVLPALETFASILRLFAATLHGIFVAPFRGGRLRIDRAILELDAAANGALPIVTLISFLLGLILAMQAWVQLRVWGADIYMADMVGVSIVTEIGPLMTAIILAARSGSSNAAQLGAMVVSEEVDALVQMGVHPVRFLVVPKVIASAVSVVALSLLFAVVGMCGGALFAFSVAGIEPEAYRVQTQLALKLPDFLVANGKALAFGTIIGVVSCALGLRVQGGSTGVGRATTNAVVLSIFLIIVMDSLFVTFQRLVLMGG